MSNPCDEEFDTPFTYHPAQSQSTLEPSPKLSFPAFRVSYNDAEGAEFQSIIMRPPTHAEAAQLDKLTNLKKKKYSVRTEYEENKISYIAYYLMAHLPVGCFSSFGGAFARVFKAARADGLALDDLIPMCFFTKQDPTVEDIYSDNITALLDENRQRLNIDLGQGIVSLDRKEINSCYKQFIIFQALKASGEFQDTPDAKEENLFPGGYAYPEITVTREGNMYFPNYNNTKLQLEDVYVALSDVEVPEKYAPFQEIYAKVALIKEFGPEIDRFLASQRKDLEKMATYVVSGDPNFALTQSIELSDRQNIPDLEVLATRNSELIKIRNRLGKSGKTAICSVPPNLNNTKVKALAMMGDELIESMEGHPFVCVGTGDGPTLRALVQSGRPSHSISIDPVTNNVTGVQDVDKWDMTLSAALPKLEELDEFYFFSDASVKKGDIKSDLNALIPKQDRTDYISTALKPDDQKFSLEESHVKLAMLPNARGAFKFVVPHLGLSPAMRAKLFKKTLALLSNLLVQKEVRLCHPLYKHEGEFYIRVLGPKDPERIKSILSNPSRPKAMAFRTLVRAYQSSYVAVNLRNRKPDSNPAIMWAMRARQIRATSNIMKHAAFKKMFQTIEELDLLSATTAVAKSALVVQEFDEHAPVHEFFSRFGVALEAYQALELHAAQPNKGTDDPFKLKSNQISMLRKYLNSPYGDPDLLLSSDMEIETEYGISVYDYLRPLANSSASQ